MADKAAAASLPSGGGSSVDEMVADLDKLVWNLPPSTPAAPASHSPSSQGLSFSVAGIGLGSSDDAVPGSISWQNAPSELMDSTLTLDFGLNEPETPPPVSNVVPAPDARGERRGRLLVQYVGGSVTFLLQIAVLAWGVRQLRRVFATRKQMQQGQQGISAARINSLPFRPVDLPLFSSLSPRAVRKLVELRHLSFLLIDVRHPDAARASPFPMESVINLPENELRACLQLGESLWESRFPTAKQPARTDLLVFISTKGQRAQRAATVAAQLGFNGCCVLSGGIESYISDTGVSSISTLGRDAVAFLLQEAGHCSSDRFLIRPRLLDVRRYDERALYGHILGSSHIPAEECPKAIAMEPNDWEKNYHFTKYAKDDVVLIYSRTNKRAIWVSQLFSDAGMTRCYALREGAFGWHLDPTVQPYTGYDSGDAPPEPIKFEVETLNREAAQVELRQKGLFGMAAQELELYIYS